ncbi:hypothetical protein BU204_35775 [Actinophytocola xanthii]|uniref:TrbL/VirB6 plasmid conjugal transfer protein n=1 Tax=Actinophytocola xanthii TaxID=1912961 RepID=A0A1Q8BY85_9PSEU|nr:hypothetical protein BU204_35775 [Actinophytocola xanthii]
MRWLLEHPQRLLTLTWLIGVLVVGTAPTASADIIVGPDLAQGSPKTLYETYDFADYKLTVKPDEENSDWFGIEDTVLQVVGYINNMILWVCLGMLNGALSLLEWFLNLTLYRDSAPEIDSATQLIADQVFWPLITATVAVGAFITYARWRGEGRGFLSDFGWVVAAGALAVGFAAGPSQLMNTVDSLRQDVANGVMTGSVNYADRQGNPTGFPTPEISGDPQKASTRRLVDGVWNTFGAIPWCLAEFRSLEVCKVAGYHALAGDEQWQQWMDSMDNGGAPPEFGEHVHWIRGQDITRTGYLLVLAMISMPMGLILLRLVIAGLIAVAGFLLMLVIGLLFLIFWPIPGWFRQLGTRYWVYTLGLQFQGLFITVVIAGSTVVSVIISTQTGKYGFFVVGVLMLALFIAALKARAWLELLTTVGGAGAMGFAAVLLVRSAMRTAVNTGATAARGAWGMARSGLGGLSVSARRTGSPTLPGFKDAGNWLGSRFGAGKNASLDEEQPFTAAVARMPLPGTDLVRRPRTDMTRTRGYRPPKAEKATVVEGSVVPNTTRRNTTTSQTSRGEFPNRPFRDRRLHKNLGRMQDETERHARVWVHKKGVGIAPVDPITPRERLSGRRVWRHLQAPGERRIAPPHTPGRDHD